MAGEDAGNSTAVSALYERLRQILGFTPPEYGLHRTGPVIEVQAPGITERAPLAIVEARPVSAVDDLLSKDADTLLTPTRRREDHPQPTPARFTPVDADGPDCPRPAGRWALVAERERWAEGRYLAVDLQLVCERNDNKRGGEIDRALTCLDADSLAPDADGAIWWQSVLEESIKHTVGVSADLREGVRSSIEIIANEVVRRRRDRGLPPLPAEKAQPLAKQALRFLYRILFLLYAEASPNSRPTRRHTEYEQGYALTDSATSSSNSST